MPEKNETPFSEEAGVLFILTQPEAVGDFQAEKSPLAPLLKRGARGI